MLRITTFILFIVCFIETYAQQFSNVSTEQNLHTIYVPTQSYGGGVSFYDFNLDGWDDLTVASGQGDSVHFYINEMGSFKKINTNVIDTFESKQILWFDADNDLDLDLLITHRWEPNDLYLNDGNLSFNKYQLPNYNSSNNNDSWGASAADLDLDGDLDLVIGQRFDASDSIPNQVFRNDGNGVFTDITKSLFLDSIYNLTLCVLLADLNHDFMPDIYTGEDKLGWQNQYYLNKGGFNFEDLTSSSGLGVYIEAMGLSIADYNFDGLMDVYVSNGPAGNPLFRNNGDNTFTNVAFSAGVPFYKVSWSNHFFDYDNDMDADIHVCATLTNNHPEVNALFENNNNGTFTNRKDLLPENDSSTSYGSGIGDLNNDGYPDIAINNLHPYKLDFLVNNGGSNHWIKINLKGVESNSYGVGSWIHVFAGGKEQLFQKICGSGFLSQNSNTMMVGLGSNQTVDSIWVEWPSGKQSKLWSVASDQTITITEGEGMSIDELISKPIVLYPNPTKSEIHFINPVKSGELTIYNIHGKSVYTKQLNRFDKKINVKGLSPGQYQFQIKNNQTRYTNTFIKD